MEIDFDKYDNTIIYNDFLNVCDMLCTPLDMDNIREVYGNRIIEDSKESIKFVHKHLIVTMKAVHGDKDYEAFGGRAVIDNIEVISSEDMLTEIMKLLAHRLVRPLDDSDAIGGYHIFYLVDAGNSFRDASYKTPVPGVYDMYTTAFRRALRIVTDYDYVGKPEFYAEQTTTNY